MRSLVVSSRGREGGPLQTERGIAGNLNRKADRVPAVPVFSNNNNNNNNNNNKNKNQKKQTTQKGKKISNNIFIWKKDTKKASWNFPTSLNSRRMDANSPAVKAMFPQNSWRHV